MVRMTESQFRLFQEGQQPKQGKRAPRAKKRHDDLPENQLEGQVLGFLRARGWTVIRNHVGRYVPLYVVMQAQEANQVIRVNTLGGRIVTIGKKGQSDYTATRPRPELGYGMQQQIHIELKAPGKRPTPEQLEWMRQKNATGEPAEWFDEFQDDWPHSFVPWYKRVMGEQ